MPYLLALDDSDRNATSSVTPRIPALAALLTLEWLAVEQVPHRWIVLNRTMIGPIAFSVCLLFFGRRRIQAAVGDTEPAAVSFAGLHLLTACLCGIAAWIQIRSVSPATHLVLLTRQVWLPLVALLSASAVTAAFPVVALGRIARALGIVWIYAVCIAVAAAGLQRLLSHEWNDATSRVGHLLATPAFYATRFLLERIYPTVLSDRAGWVLGTPTFRVAVAGACSGVEGVALMFVLALGWIVYLRRELRLDRALWLIPIAMAAIWLLNIVRIAALIAIGDAGHPTVAITGFHSQAGWIFFNLTAVLVLVAAQHWRWIRVAGANNAATLPALAEPLPGTRNVASIYLAPFLAIVAAGLFAGAVSSGFDWLYPLRLAAACVALWLFRAEYRRMDLRFDWLGPAAGLAVGALWIALAHLFPAPSAPLAAGLGRLPSPERITWIVLRTLAAVATVPVAEELAFRGYLARRLTGSDPESVLYARITPVAIFISSALFGWMHGRMWPAGFLAGLTFALVARRRNRLGEAIAAHAAANAIVALYVLTRGDLSLW